MAGLAAGMSLGPYEIVQVLGEGGMGVVYKALDTRLKRFVAIKVLRAETLADLERRRRFVQEAQAASALNHPNIVTIHDIGPNDGVDYIAMEYVAGKTLDALIPRKGMRIKDVLRIAVQIASGLERAHTAGIVHRDLKPGNIIIGDDGQVKILDFGLAKLTERATVPDEASTATVKPETKEGAVVGTAAYMSPEQAEGRPVDARSDIFSFGSVLYEMVTGERAFRGQSAMSTMAAILNQEPKAVSAFAPEVPRDLEKIIHRCLRKDPERRFQHMADIRVALVELKDESDSGLLPAAGATQATGRRRRWVWMGWLAVILVLAGGVGLWWRNPAKPAAEPRMLLLTSEPGRHRTPALSPEGRQVAYAWNPEGGDAASIYVKLVDAGNPLRLTNEPNTTDISPAWSPDGRYIAFCRTSPNGSEILRVPALGGPAQRVAAVKSCSYQMLDWGLAWSPDGRFLAATDGIGPGPLGIVLIALDTGQKIRLTSPPPDYFADLRPKFSPDGKALAFARARSMVNESLYTISVAADGTPGRAPRMVAGLGPDVRILDCDWTSDARRILVIRNSPWGPLSGIPASGGEVFNLPEAGERVRSVSVSRTGHRLVYERVAADTNIWRIPGPAGSKNGPAARLIASTEGDLEPQYSPVGTRIAFTSDRSGYGQLWISDADGRNPVPLTSDEKLNPGSPRWSPDGAWIAFDSIASSTIAVMIISAQGGSPRRFVTESIASRPSWSRDGRWLYFGSNRTGQMQIWKAPVPGGPATQVTRTGGQEAFESMDGKFLYWAKPDSPGIWRMPVSGGEEKRITETSGMNLFAVAPPGVWFFEANPATGGYSLKMLDEASGSVKTFRDLPEITDLDRVSTAMSLSPDGRWIVFTRVEQFGSNLVMLDGIR